MLVQLINHFLYVTFRIFKGEQKEKKKEKRKKKKESINLLLKRNNKTLLFLSFTYIYFNHYNACSNKNNVSR